MAKKCIICEEEAKFYIKNTSDYYCDECAQDNFSDIDLLEKVDSQIKALKEYIDNRIEDVYYIENSEPVVEDLSLEKKEQDS